MWYAQLVSDDLCKRVFDFAVNAGSAASVRCLQQALNTLAGSGAAQLVDDSDWGPMTLDAANSADPAALVAAFQDARVAFYQAIVADKPSLSIYLATWTTRAQK
jgi:type VI secretion system secreted protein VgrG